MPTLDQLAIQKSDRATIVGASGSGKSTLARFLLTNWQENYCQPKKRGTGRLLILDTKPRWRATQALTGKSIQSRYKDFVKGDTITGVILDSMKGWDLSWSKELNPTQTVICQAPELDDADNVRWQVQAAAKFFQTQKPSQPSLIYIDEGMDFYGPTGNSRYGNAIQKCFRAGREKGLATLLGVQRPKCISLQTLTEANVLYLFRLEYSQDVKRLTEMGFPQRMEPPDEDYRFLYMRSHKMYPNQLTLPKEMAQ